MMGAPIRVRDLPNTSDLCPCPMLRCMECGNEYSAHGPDYFMCNPDTVFTCPSCREPLALVVKRVQYVDWLNEEEIYE